MNKQGNLFVVSGFSGSGKGTVMKWFKEQENYALSISCTSRQPRIGETDGVDYYFITHEDFLKKIDEGYFLEHAVYVNKAYGTPAAFVRENLAAGKDVILEIEMQGAMQVKETYPDTVLIFITPPSVAELKRRLTGRGTESPAEIQQRLSRAVKEGAFMDQYDYIIVNDDLNTCIHQLHELMQSTHHKVKNNSEFVAGMKEELKTLIEGE